MAVRVHGMRLPNSDNENFMDKFYEDFKPTLGKGALEFQNIPVKEVSDKDITLYVDQHEYAVVCGDDSQRVTKLGSDMATTCHIVILYHAATKVAGVAHCNGPRAPEIHDPLTKQGMYALVGDVAREVVDRSGGSVSDGIELDLKIIGGFTDKQGLSHLLSVHLLKDFDLYCPPVGIPKVSFNLTLFCSSKWNNKKVDEEFGLESYDSWIIGGAVCDADTGEVVPAQFVGDSRAPVIARRGARWMTNVPEYPNIYSIKDYSFVLQSFFYRRSFDDIPYLLSLSCQQLKDKLSTSPKVEAEDYCEYTRAALRFILDNPDPLTLLPVKLQAQIMDGRLTWQ